MAESYYSSSPAPNLPGSPSSLRGPPPPPPPKPSSHDPNQTGVANVTQSPRQYLGQTYSSGGPIPPPIPPSPSHAQALARQQQQQQQTQNQQPQPQPEQQAQQYRQHAEQSHGHSSFSPSDLQRAGSATAPAVSNGISPPSLDSGWLPESLSSKQTTDLQFVLNNSELLNALAHEHPSYLASLEPLKAAVSQNIALAQQVGQLEDQVKSLREQTGQLLINHSSLYTQWKRKEGDMNDALSPWESRAMYQRLVSSIAEQEGLLRAVHESFLDDGADHDTFHGNGNGKASEKEVTEWVKRLREGTTILEKRREMRARWDEGRVGGLR